MKIIVSRYVNALIKSELITEEEYDKCEYQLLCITESIIVMVSMLVLGIAFNCFINVIMYMVCFFTIRNRAGGYHLSTFGKCFIGTLVLELIGIVMIKNNSIIIEKGIDVVVLFAFFFIIRIGALNHPNLQLSYEEFRVTKKLSRINAGIFALIIIILKWIDAPHETILFIEYAVILSAVLLCLGKITGQYIRLD